MPLRNPWLLTLLFTLMAAGCATSRFLEEAEIYERHAGDPVPEIRFMRLRDWRPVSADLLMIRTQGNEYYLVEPELPCAGHVRFTRTLVIPQSTGHVNLTPLDDLTLDGQRCRIRSLRALDYKGVQADLAEVRP